MDFNNDWKENWDDALYVLRSIDDPLNKLKPSLRISDANGDKVIDLNDAIYIVSVFEKKYNETGTFGNLTAFFEDFDVVFNQTGTRRLAKSEIPDGSRRYGSSARSNEYPEFMEIAVNGSVRRNLQSGNTCGANANGNFQKGKGSKPKMTWDQANCRYNPNLWDKMSYAQRIRANLDWLKWGGAPFVGSFFLGQPDGARAYEHYRSGTGTTITADYQKAINEDPVIKAVYDQAIADVKKAALIMFAEESSFAFHSLKPFSVPNGNSVNWQRTLGGHSIWFEGTVAYNKDQCVLDITMTLFFEDYYNFNPGQTDITTGIPDNVNCLFEQLGWAKGFFTRGTLPIKETAKLFCCKDSDCGDETVYDCECGKCLAQCPAESFSGGQGFQSYAVNLKKKQGTFIFSYEMYQNPDQSDIYYEGSLIYSTGGLVSGSKTVPVKFGSAKSKSTIISINMIAPNAGTQWVFTVTCPP